MSYFLIDVYIKSKSLKFDFSKNLQLVLLAIISDVMPLRKINRLIAQKVLKNFDITNDYFFKKFLNLNKLKDLCEIDDFGFLLSPILNSVGRLGDPNIVVELLTSYETKLKDQIIDKLILLNNKRKIIEYDILKINLNKLNIDKRL